MNFNNNDPGYKNIHPRPSKQIITGQGIAQSFDDDAAKPNLLIKQYITEIKFPSSEGQLT